MSFKEMLANFVGRTIEVFTVNQFYTGVLLSVDNSTITLQVPNPYYVPDSPTLIFQSQIQYVRIPAA